jgi:hypothetical protein
MLTVNQLFLGDLVGTLYNDIVLYNMHTLVYLLDHTHLLHYDWNLCCVLCGAFSLCKFVPDQQFGEARKS